jgi:tetratricopeptide (TPR) repeat protein
MLINGYLPVMKRIQPIIVCISLMAAPVTWGDTASNKLEQRLKQVKKLLVTSSGAVVVEKGGKEEAIALRDDAMAQYHNAVSASEAGKTDLANEMLTNATTKMFEAIRVANSNVENSSASSNLMRKWESVNALLKAMERIQSEKEIDETMALTMSQIDTYLQQAKLLEEKDEQQGALVMLGQALDLLKENIERMRGGETLVNSLNFTDKGEEYHYELDRNNTHMMLVDVLTKEKKLSDNTSRQIKEWIKKANDQRKNAESLAAEGEMEDAISALEDSTKQLVRAIRMAGVYIPG